LTELDHSKLYAWVQAVGEAVIEAEDRLQMAVFDDGGLPPRDEQVHDLVVAAAEATSSRLSARMRPTSRCASASSTASGT
jgi:hypothetical protein